MTDNFLVEIGTEELPPKALKNLSLAFRNAIDGALKEAQLPYASIQWFATPRRLAVFVKNLAEGQQDSVIEKLGPALKAAYDDKGNATKAALGFARSNGVSLEQLQELDTDKGKRLAYRAKVTGKTSEELLPGIVSSALSELPIPKRMRWGASKEEFVRPVHWIVMLVGNKVIDCEILGQRASNVTRGHRFHYDHAITLDCAEDFERILKQRAYVIADFNKRRALIKDQLEEQARAINGIAQIDDALLDEVTALVEWPVALTGRFEERFLAVPPEALISSMKEHQKYFHVFNSEGELLPYFITIANIESEQPEKVIDGNERVIRPRLADAAFFFETDKKTPLSQQCNKLKSIVFQHRLGSVFGKTQRLEKLSALIAELIGAEPSLARRAAQLSKADLVSEMVHEFEDLQGIMGLHYARHDGEPEEVALALNEQYLPGFAGDELPGTLTGCALALADRLDTLVGIFGIGEPPTGNKDPFALRRAAIGVLNIIVKKQLDLDLRQLLEAATGQYDNLPKAEGLVDAVLAYLIERFRAWYAGEGIATEIFLAVSAKNISAPLDFDQRVQAVYQFSQLASASALAAANKRVSNILAKQVEKTAQIQIDPSLLRESAEIDLAEQISALATQIAPLIKAKDYKQVLTNLAELRNPVDAFFDNVMVMVEDEVLKMNRIAILQSLRGLFLEVADISLLATSK